MFCNSRFGGRLVFYDPGAGSGDVTLSPSFTYNETNANFSAIRDATGLTFTMPAADTSGSYADGIAVRVNSPGTVNMEALLKFTASTIAENLPGIMVRGSGSYASPVQSRDATCHWFELDEDSSTTIQLVRSVAGSGTVVATGTAVAWTTGQDSFLRVACVGSNFYAKAWPASSAEPADWQLKAADTTISQGTRFGLGLNGGASASTTFTFVAKNFWVWDLTTIGSPYPEIDEDGGVGSITLDPITATGSGTVIDGGLVLSIYVARIPRRHRWKCRQPVTARAGVWLHATTTTTGTGAITLDPITSAGAGGFVGGPGAATLDPVTATGIGYVGIIGGGTGEPGRGHLIPPPRRLIVRR